MTDQDCTNFCLIVAQYFDNNLTVQPRMNEEIPSEKANTVNSTNPNTGYPDRQLSGSAWSFG